MVELKGIDLVGDVWHDYQHYLSEARAAKVSGDTHALNRGIRAALGALIAHLDGVVVDLHRRLSRVRADFRARRRPHGRCTLKDKIDDLHEHCSRRMRRTPPDLGIQLIKPLRDILAHPSIIKPQVDRETGRTIKLSEHNLYDIDIEKLDACGRRIGAWLDEVCRAYGYPRIHDTKSTVEKLAKGLGLRNHEARRL